MRYTLCIFVLCFAGVSLASGGKSKSNTKKVSIKPRQLTIPFNKRPDQNCDVSGSNHGNPHCLDDYHEEKITIITDLASASLSSSPSSTSEKKIKQELEETDDDTDFLQVPIPPKKAPLEISRPRDNTKKLGLQGESFKKKEEKTLKKIKKIIIHDDTNDEEPIEQSKNCINRLVWCAGCSCVCMLAGILGTVAYLHKW